MVHLLPFSPSEKNNAIVFYRNSVPLIRVIYYDDQFLRILKRYHFSANLLYFQGNINRDVQVISLTGEVRMQLNDWVKLRTFSHQQFQDLQILLNKKREKQQTISLCLPALNEALTIGKIIKILKKALQDHVALIDEIIVIDSGSTDGTQEIARKAGASVYQASEILPETGNFRGKGENLWKSLYVSQGDIIVWLDTDIRNMSPHFVTGLLGPLLYHEEISFVKGFYRRPLQVGKKIAPTGGGRVTEILVKPLFNLLFPQLAVFQQPLSGEYAGRRELLERIPFFTGYGVETGMLIDLESRFGISCMAQVDLDVRIHRNQDLQALRRMAFGILRILFTRAEQQGKIVLLDNLGNQLIHMVRNELGYFDIHLVEISEIERPPIILNKSYQEKRQFSEEDLILVDEIRKRRQVRFLSISQFMDSRLVFLNGQARDKETILQQISRHLAQDGTARDFARLVHEFYKRENIMSTGIGSGIAIPHVLSPVIRQTRIVVYRPESPVLFNALDGQPVNLILAVVSPAARRQCHLQILANITAVLRDKEMREKLLTADSPDEFISLFRKLEAVKRIERDLRIIES